MRTLNMTHEIAGVEAVEIRGGGYVEFGIGFIYGIGAVATLSGIGLVGVAAAGAVFYAYDAWVSSGN